MSQRNQRNKFIPPVVQRKNNSSMDEDFFLSTLVDSDL